MHLDLVGESSWQLLDDGLGIRPGIYANVLALERADERFIPFDRGLLTGVVRGIRPISRGKARAVSAAAVVAQPLDWFGQAVHRTVAMLDGG